MAKRNKCFLSISCCCKKRLPSFLRFDSFYSFYLKSNGASFFRNNAYLSYVFFAVYLHDLRKRIFLLKGLFILFISHVITFESTQQNVIRKLSFSHSCAFFSTLFFIFAAWQFLLYNANIFLPKLSNKRYTLTSILISGFLQDRKSVV